MLRFLRGLFCGWICFCSVSSCFALQEKPQPGDQVFSGSDVVQIHLTLTPKQFEALQPRQPFPGPPGAFGAPGNSRNAGDVQFGHTNTFGIELPWSSANVDFNGTVYRKAGIRYKGNYTFLATSRSLKRSFKLDINRHDDDQKLDGLTMLNLHCGVSDPTLLREAFSYQFFRDAGVPAPRTTFADVYLTVEGQHDREYVGVYTLTEQVNKPFLKRHFGNGGGLLLKPEGLQGGPAFLGDDWAKYEPAFRPDDEPTKAQQQRLMDFTRLISESTDDEFSQQIEDFLDVDAFLRFIAANALLSNLDSYLGFGHNYYLYLNPTSNKFVFIPWDLDLSLATWPAVGTPEQLVKLSLKHPHAGDNRLLDRIFAIAKYNDRYFELIRELCEGPFTVERLSARLNQLETTVAEPRSRDADSKEKRGENAAAPGFGPGFGNGQFGQSMPPQEFIRQRTASVAAQLAGEEQGFVPRPFGGFGSFRGTENE